MKLIKAILLSLLTVTVITAGLFVLTIVPAWLSTMVSIIALVTIFTGFWYKGSYGEPAITPQIIEKQGESQDKGEISDGYHTFNELYCYRMLYNAAFFNMLPKEWVHKSKKHHDGEECFGGGWFVVMANLPTGQISNHYELKDWNLFQIPEKEVADKWDGHTPQEAADRLHKYLLEKQGEQKPTMIQWTGDNLKELVHFTGKSPKFEEWFKTWEDFENYVHTHNNIFKIFNEDGSHIEIPVGAWIVKTPDGYNVASRYVFKQKLADKTEPKFKVGDNIRRKTPSSCDKDMQVARIEKDYYICNHIGKFSSEVVPFSKEPSYELIEQKPAYKNESAWQYKATEELYNQLKEL